MKNKIIMATLAVTIAGSALWGTTAVNAQDKLQYTDIATRIAHKFNLNEREIKAVFDEVHKERHAHMQVKLEERLTQAVTDGKITETQKQALLAKLKELQAQKQSTLESMQNMTPEQRKATMEEHKAELKTWAQTNGINLQNLGGIISHKGFGRGLK